ncbi:hypothetical protein C7974DRAFT_141897 [Boeremia exigua]|uniref:uncharacterized protein n=1 Tax=Boeremia exigua TaxID=749465 RepID=UPI001E8EA386|nr:uncharacterized protein C7974DRAFT_141897 [Boeremia exigua]KAH6637472.1 hypothetical protein C7974DRAFT_141897 [Boeremia exigua]
MGKYRSRSGCLTCRARRVKCDETRPVCNACSKKNRPCQWETLHTKFKDYQPSERASSKSTTGEGDSENMDIDGADDEESLGSRHSPPRTNEARGIGRAIAASASTSRSMSDPSPDDSIAINTPGSRSQSGISVASLLRHPVLEGTRPYSEEAVPLTQSEAQLVHHYSEYLGRWLDCTDATRQFTLGVPEKVKSCPVLCHAVLSFAARHQRKDNVADAAYQRCIALLINRLDEASASHDEMLLCAIVILRFYEQLNVPSTTGSDAARHLAGSSAILRASQGNHYVDPSAPTLREASFWVYVRQCLYTATTNQQPLDVDFSLQLHPTPGSMQDSHPLARLRLETAWANQMTWNTALIVNFCFETNPSRDRNSRLARWRELWDLVQSWGRDRPEGFSPIWQGPAEDSCFSHIWFTADWHAVAFGLYHFACLMLHSFKPGPRFAIRSVGSLSNTDHQILEHARAICGACKSTPETVQLSITLCHTIFVWGPLVTDPKERDEVLQLLLDFERSHVWPTAWISNALKEEWGLDQDSC